uniref:Conserved oligomeric Golgi complex subunit 6 n=1 Tax=Strongyloides papillosus TaxID=174720 RepID=A0A0N5BHH8_STREA
MTALTSQKSGTGNDNEIKEKISKIMAIKLDKDQGVINEIEFLNNLVTTLNIHTERNLVQSAEEGMLEAQKEYLSNFTKLSEEVSVFKERVERMNEVCINLRNQIKTNKEKTRDLLEKTSVIQKEKKTLEDKKNYVNTFLDTYSLTDEEEDVLKECFDTGNINDKFFKVFNRLKNINLTIPEKLEEDDKIVALYDMKDDGEYKLKQCYGLIVRYIQSEVRSLNHEFMEPKPLLFDAFKAIEKISELMEVSITEYCSVRRTYIVRAFLDALMKGGNGETGIEYNSNDPLVYIYDMLNWINSAITIEYEMLENLLKNCDHRIREKYFQDALGEISEALCQATKVRVETSLAKESNCVVVYQISTSFAWCVDSLKILLSEDSVFIATLNDLRDLALNLFFSILNSNIQKLLNRNTLPDYDLKPILNIYQCLGLLKSILDCTASVSNNQINLAARKDIQTKILTCILDPLNQAIQLACSKLHDPLDSAVYMINCLNEIRDIIIIYQFTETRLEMIKCQIEANEDLIVGDQASRILTNCQLMDLYVRCNGHQQSQGPLSKVIEASPDKVKEVMKKFYSEIKSIDGIECDQLPKILCVRIVDSIRKRTLEHVVLAYSVIYEKITNPINGYPVDTMELKTVDEIKNEVMAEFNESNSSATLN